MADMGILSTIADFLRGEQMPVVRPAAQGGSIGVPLPRPNPIRVEPRISGVMQERARNNAGPVGPSLSPQAPSPALQAREPDMGGGKGLLSGVNIPTLSGETDLGSVLRAAAAGFGNVDPNANDLQQAASAFLGSSTAGEMMRERRNERAGREASTAQLYAAIDAMPDLTPAQKAAAKADPSIAADLIKTSITPQKPELTTIFNEDGTEQRAWVYPDGRAFPLGGKKPATMDTSPTTQKFYDPETKTTIIKQYDPRSNEWFPIGTSKGAEGDAGPKFSDVTSARKDFENQPGVSRYRTAAPILSSMAKSVDDPSTMADLDFIYGMAKIYDPTSVVRESEMGLVIQGQSLPAQIVGMFNKVANGEQALGPQVRKDLVRSSRTRVGEYRAQAESESSEFSSLAERNGIDPQDVVRPLEPMPEFFDPTEGAATGQATPAPGGASGSDPLAKARAAIQAGADPAAVADRLRKAGIDPSGL